MIDIHQKGHNPTIIVKKSVYYIKFVICNTAAGKCKAGWQG